VAIDKYNLILGAWFCQQCIRRIWLAPRKLAQLKAAQIGVFPQFIARAGKAALQKFAEGLLPGWRGRLGLLRKRSLQAR
jgi:hypothetical protein